MTDWKKGSFALMLLLCICTGMRAQRQVLPFNDGWEFKKADRKKPLSLISGDWTPVTVPHTWNNVDMQTGKDFYQGDAFYRKTFFPDTAWKDRRIFIRFEAVGQTAEVYVNEKFIGQHRGGYSAFCFDISYALKWNEKNTIVVKAGNEPSPGIIPVNTNLFAVYGGIYRPVSLVVTGKLNIAVTDYASAGVYVRQKNVTAGSADIAITTKLENKTMQPQALTLESVVSDATGRTVQSTTSDITLLPQGLQHLEQSLSLKRPHLWNGLADPYLYRVTVRVKRRNEVLDEVIQPLGIRRFEIIEGKGFCLNGQPYRLLGVCRHQDQWSYGNALSNAQHAADLDMIREVGATSIRLAHYEQSEYFYAKADSMGFIVWAEIPFVNAVSGQEADNAKQQLTELIRQNYNHPCIYVWGLHNEVYGRSPADYTSVLTATLHELAKTEDPDRFTVSVNGYGTMERYENGLADIQGMNRYYGWYEGKTGDLAAWVERLQEKYPHHKVILSEYGAEGNVQQQDEALPSRVDPVNGKYYPEQLETRLHEVQWGIIAKHPYLIGSYVWNMFDFAVPLWNRGGIPARNMKGLVTFDRKIKKDAFYWYKANWSKEPVLYISDRRLTQRKLADAVVTVYSNRGTPVLTVNGQQAQPPRQGTTAVHYIFDHVTLQKGKNVIRVNNGNGYTDEVEWMLE